MAALKENTEVRLKLVMQQNSGDGSMKQVSRTYSNIAQDVSDDVLYAGAQAMAPLFAQTPSAIVRVEEATLIQG